MKWSLVICASILNIPLPADYTVLILFSSKRRGSQLINKWAIEGAYTVCVRVYIYVYIYTYIYSYRESKATLCRVL